MSSTRSIAGALVARRAVARWVARAMRRDWRQHVLIVLAMTVAVAAAVGFTCAVDNLSPATVHRGVGDADAMLDIELEDGVDPQRVVDAAEAWFPAVEVVRHERAALPGLAQPVDVRAQAPDGPFGSPLLHVIDGRFPGAGEAALTRGLARSLDVSVGSRLDLDAGAGAGAGAATGSAAVAVVGIVEDPTSLHDEFVLVPPGSIDGGDRVTLLVRGSATDVMGFRPDGRAHVFVVGAQQRDVLASVLTLVVSTVVMFLVALIAAASFTVIAQRRLPQLGMMSAMGATERHVRLTLVVMGAITGLVAAVLGTLLGLAGWALLAPALEGTVGHRIDPWRIPWPLVAAAFVLAVLTAIGAAWWPARAVARIPVVAALRGNPPRPRALHRSAVLIVVLLAGGVVSLTIAGRSIGPLSGGEQALLIGGLIAVLIGILLVGPIAIRAVATLARVVPVSARIALRDLARYQARSGAALAAICLALGIPVGLVAATRAAENSDGLGNLPADQLVVHGDGLDRPFVPSAATATPMAAGVQRIVAALDGSSAVEVRAFLPAGADPGDAGRSPAITVAHAEPGGGAGAPTLVALATPELLHLYGLDADALDASATIATEVPGPVVLVGGDGPDRSGPPTISPLTATQPLAAAWSSFPGALATASTARALGWVDVPAGEWIITLPHAATDADVATARGIAASTGMVVERRDERESLADLRYGSVAVGILMALGILAMTVGLIRAESDGDLRTLTAIGATARSRRAITAITAATLALLGALLAVAGAYTTLGAGGVDHLTPLPWPDLAEIVIGTPLLALVAGVLLAWREPTAVARRAIS